MRANRLAINICASFISFGITFGISFMLTPYITSTLGKETYQFYPIANNFMNYMAIAVSALNSMASRFITVSYAKGERNRVNVLFSSLFFSNLILCGLLLIPMVTLVILCPSFLQIPEQSLSDVRGLFTLVFMSMQIDIMGSVFGTSTIATNRIDLRSGISIITASLRALSLMLALRCFQPKLVYIGIAAVVVSIAQCMLNYRFTKRVMPYVQIKKRYFEKAAIYGLLASGTWNSISSIGTSLLTGVILILTNMLAGASAGGELSIAQTLSHVMNSIISMIIVIFLPRMIQSYAIDGTASLAKETMFSEKINSIVCSVPILLLMTFGKDFFKLWVPQEDASILYSLLVVLLLPLYIQANMWTLQNVFVALNKVKVPAIATLIAGTANVTVIFVINMFTKLTAINITLISSIICSIFYLTFYPYYSARVLGKKTKEMYSVILHSMFVTVPLLSLSRLIHRSIVIQSWLQFFLYGAAFGISMLLIYSLLMLNSAERVSLLQNVLRRFRDK